MSIKTYMQQWQAEWRGDGKWFMLFLVVLTTVNSLVLLHFLTAMD